MSKQNFLTYSDCVCGCECVCVCECVVVHIQPHFTEDGRGVSFGGQERERERKIDIERGVLKGLSCM